MKNMASLLSWVVGRSTRTIARAEEVALGGRDPIARGPSGPAIPARGTSYRVGRHEIADPTRRRRAGPYVRGRRRSPRRWPPSDHVGASRSGARRGRGAPKHAPRWVPVPFG